MSSQRKRHPPRAETAPFCQFCRQKSHAPFKVAHKSGIIFVLCNNCLGPHYAKFCRQIISVLHESGAEMLKLATIKWALAYE